MFRKVCFPGLVLCLLSFTNAPNENNDRWAVVKKGDLEINLTEKGEISAVKSTLVSAPPMWTVELQITDLAPEGSFVDSGDVLVRFDQSALLSKLEEEQTKLEEGQAELKKMLVEQQGEIAGLERDLEMAKYSMQIAELQVEQLKFESEVRRDEGKLDFLKAEIALKEAGTKLESQKIINKSNRQKQELKILQAQGEVNKIQRDLDRFTLYAPLSGMVVYHTDWSGNKPQLGAKMNPGMGVIQLPDLSKMQVKIRINEVDARKLKEQQTAVLRLEAYPENEFTAAVKSSNIIAEARERRSQVRVFDAFLEIAETDTLLKPGMTAKVNISTASIPNTNIIPAGCLFEIDGEAVVFTRNSPSKPRTVKVLGRNDFYAAVEGVEEGTEISLRAGNAKAKPFGYANFMRHVRPPSEAREAFFTEMEKRNLSFDYEEFRNRPPEPPGGAPGGMKAMLKKFGFPGGEMKAEGGKITISPGDLKNLKSTVVKIDSSQAKGDSLKKKVGSKK